MSLACVNVSSNMTVSGWTEYPANAETRDFTVR